MYDFSVPVGAQCVSHFCVDHQGEVRGDSQQLALPVQPLPSQLVLHHQERPHPVHQGTALVRTVRGGEHLPSVLQNRLRD